MSRQDEIKLIAYSLWEEEGSVNGCDMEHWLKAEIIWESGQKTDKTQTAESESESVNASSSPMKTKTIKTNKTAGKHSKR